MNLLSVQGTGAVLTVALFLLCILIVHAVKLARIGWRTLIKKLPPEEPNRSEPKPEPVYFIVERKKKRSKAKPKKVVEKAEPKPEPEPVYFIVERTKKRVKTPSKKTVKQTVKKPASTSRTEYSEPKQIVFK